MKINRHTRLALRLHDAAFVLLLLVLLILTAWFTQTWRYTADWTQAGRHTVSAESREIIALFKEPITIEAWIGPNQATRNAVTTLIDRYRRAGANIELDFVNPETRPAEARELGIRPGGELIIRHDGREERLQQASEAAISSALGRLSLDEERWIVFLQGQGERDPLGSANHDLGTFGERLIERGFHVQTLDLTEIPGIPDNTDLLVIAGPREDYPATHRERIERHLQRGGNLLWLSDPDSHVGLEPVAQVLGIRKLPGVVLDPAGSRLGLDNPAFIAVSEYPEHPVTRGLTGLILLPETRALEILGDNAWNHTPLLRTGPGAYRQDSEPDGTPLLLGVAGTRTIDDREQRSAVLGDGDFLANAFVANGVNLELGMRLIHWLAGDDERMHVTPRRPLDEEIHLSPLVGGIIGLGFLLVLPALILLTGVTIWWRRKHN